MQLVVNDMKDYNRILYEDLKLNLKHFYINEVVEKLESLY